VKPINNALQAVLENKRRQLEEEKAATPLKELEKRLEIKKGGGFAKCIKKQPKLNIIAEFKRASASAGALNPDLKIDEFTKQIAVAQAVSILTERKFFLGSEADLEAFKKISDKPVLRKDFLIDEYDVIKTAVLGADCVLLICAILDKGQLKRFYDLAAQLGLDALVEAHDKKELESALELGAKIIGINNRNLKTFEVDIKNTEKLIKYLPDGVIKVAESGIKTPQDALYIKSLGADAALIGTAFSQSASVSETIRMLRV
jgi:indole-3-glycerol phosphate synthase